LTAAAAAAAGDDDDDDDAVMTTLLVSPTAAERCRVVCVVAMPTRRDVTSQCTVFAFAA